MRHTKNLPRWSSFDQVQYRKKERKKEYFIEYKNQLIFNFIILSHKYLKLES